MFFYNPKKAKCHPNFQLKKSAFEVAFLAVFPAFLFLERINTICY